MKGDAEGQTESPGSDCEGPTLGVSGGNEGDRGFWPLMRVLATVCACLHIVGWATVKFKDLKNQRVRKARQQGEECKKEKRKKKSGS